MEGTNLSQQKDRFYLEAYQGFHMGSAPLEFQQFRDSMQSGNDSAECQIPSAPESSFGNPVELYKQGVQSGVFRG